jgi:hypothetical protein
MGVPDGASVWQAVESRYQHFLTRDGEAALLELLTERFHALGRPVTAFDE